jgi:hypothetical protein
MGLTLWASKSKGDPHPQTIVLSVVFAGAQIGQLLSDSGACPDVTHEKWLQEEKSGRLARRGRDTGSD